MKLQYIFRSSMAHSSVSLYCDGKFVEKKTFWDDYSAVEYMDKIEADGYEHAYTDEDIHSALAQYEYALAHRLMKEENK